MKTLIIFFLMCGVCFAEDIIKDKSNIEWRAIKQTDFDITLDKKGNIKESKLKQEYVKEEFSLELDGEGRYKNLVKVDIPEDKLLTEEESKAVKTTLCNTGLVDDVSKKAKEGRNLIHLESKPAKNDYKNDFDRGTVYFNPEKGNIFSPDKLKMRNYSFHKVIIPDGTVIEGVNFSQKNPHTVAITGKNLHFIQCNLNNVQIDPTWTFEGGLRIHSKHEIEIVGEKTFNVYYVEKDDKWKELSREEIISK